MTEFGLIDTIKALCSTLPDNTFEGIGDDCAVLPIGNNESLLFTQDSLIERIHFLREAISPYELGRKSLSVNLSDVAAMGGRPTASLLSLSVPEQLMGEWIEEFMRGYTDLSRESGVALVGGDTTRSTDDFAICITAIGCATNSHIKRRGDAKVGDKIYVTGELGGSGLGLREILKGSINPKSPHQHTHNNPTARIPEGEWLGAHAEIHAMMDISDGVASDLCHILRASQVGASIELSQIPKPQEADLHTALCSGEDYELLLTIDGAASEKICELYAQQFKRPLYPIGEIVADDKIIWLQNGAPCDAQFKGFTHY